ncbi:MAG: BCCT family transporter, partial [Terrabacter sp.]
GLAVSLVKDLARDPQVVRRQYAVAAVEHAVVAGVSEHGDDFSLAVQETAPGEGVGEMVQTDPVESAEKVEPVPPLRSAGDGSDEVSEHTEKVGASMRL